MIDQRAEARPCPRRWCEQIVAKTDGVPLFVEELTKMLLESRPAAGEGQIAMC